ncbi:Apolipophorins [Eumeta japonica]|uniref:Apolipophorins n=1 Tax=Eumeta variegata TaxID=151549 RepID=A0A4C1YX56_EUMVA|nr:Apolipophorins [Eumeta japonica]
MSRHVRSLGADTPHNNLKWSSNRCALLAPGTLIRGSAQDKSSRDFLCRDAHLTASIGQSRADDIPCRSAATDEVLKAPIYWGYGQQPNNTFASRVFWSVKLGHTPRTRVRGSSLAISFRFASSAYSILEDKHSEDSDSPGSRSLKTSIVSVPSPIRRPSPHHGVITQSVSRQQPQQGSSGSPAYLTGHKYSYSVDGDVSVYLTGADQQETGVKLSAQVTVSALGNCAHVLRVQNLIITGPGGKKYGKPPGIEKPVRFTLEDGALGAEICAEDGDTRRSLNIKRAIISLLQNEHKQASEVDVFGVCPTQSSSSQEGPARLVHRSRDLGRCAHREQGGQALVAAVYNPNALLSRALSAATGSRNSVTKIKPNTPPFRLPCSSAERSFNVYVYGITVRSSHGSRRAPTKSDEYEIKDSQVLQSTLYVESKVTNGVPEKVSATEEYLYKPFSVGQNGARAKVNTRLSLVGKTGGSDNGRFMDVRSIIFENPHGEKSEQSNMNNALKAVKDTAKLVADQASYQSAGAFAQLIRILRVTNMNDLLSVYGQVKGNSLLRRVFLDGLLRAGTAASIEASVQLVKSGEMSQLEQSLVYLSLANAKHVDNDAVTAAATLLDTPNIPKEVYLGVGALAGAYCREHKCHARGSQSDGIATLSQKLVSKLNCRPTSKVEEDYTVAILKGIRNIRHIEDCLIGKLVQCVRDDSVKARVKVAALEAYQADPCSTQLKDTAIEAMKNRELDSEVRIKAYLTVILCPCGRCANEIKNLLDDEPSIQVGRYISTSLRHIKASANPDMQLAREHFSQIRIPTKYSVDDRKYSFYREFSYNVDALGTGGVLEQSVIYSQESFLPRSISLNLTAEVFGHSVNVFEIGGRQGNLDRVMEHFLGPKGYVRQNSPQEIYEDIVHRYEEVHKKVQGKFRGRRSLQQDIKNFDKQIKDEGEPYNNELDLDIYVKLFGTDAVFLSLGDNKGFNFNSVLDSMLKYVENGCNSMKHFQEEIRAHILFLDAELAYPTSLGLPLKLNLIGSATARLEAATKIDVKQIMRDPANAKIDIKLNPSTDIQISGQLVIDADQVMTGLKVSANLHSATGGHLLVQTVENGQGFDLQYVLPEKKLEIVTASNDLVYVTAEKGHPETTVALKVDTDRKEYYGCFDQLSSLFGLTLCGEISVPFSVSGPEAQVSIQKYLARYPLTGSSMIKAHLEQNDLRGYHVKGVLRRENRMRQSFELLFETQGSQTRKTALTGELVNSPEEKTIKLGLESPIKNLYGQATLYTKRSEVTAMVLAKLDAEKYYGRIGFNVQGNEQRSVYKPFIEYEMPGTQGTKSMNVRGQVIRQSSGPTTIFTLDGIRIDIDQRESIDMKGKATFVRNGFECDLEVNKGPQNMAVRLSAKDHDLNVRFTNTLNPYVNFDLKVHSENRDKYYQNDVDLCYGDNLDARRQTVIVKQLLKYQETDSGKYNVHTRNELSVNHIPLSAKFYAEIDSKKVDVELEGKFGTNKAEFDLEARTHIKAPGDYSIKIDAEVDDKGVELVAKRDIVNADQSNFENVFVIKNMVKYELSGVVTHRNKPDDVNFGTVGHLKVSGGGKTEDLKFDIGLQNNPSTYMSHAEITKGTVKFLYYSLKVVRGANPNGELKFELKNTVNCHGNYKVTDADGSGSGIIIVDFVKLPRKLKGDIRFKVKAPIYSVDGDLYLNYEKDNNDKIHFSTNTKSSDATFDSKNKLDYDGKCTELNIFVDGATNVANGKFKGQVQVVLPSERTLELGLARDAATQNDVVNGNAELVLSDAPKRGATPSKFVYKGKIIDTSYKTNSFNYEGQILISLKDGRSLQNSFFLKNIPQGNDKFKFDFKSEVNGNLIPKPASITASNEYTHSGKMLINDNNKYRVKGSYGGDCTFDLDFKDETQLDAGDKKYYLYFDLVTNLPFEKVHYIKIKSDELYLYSENKDVGFEYNLKEMVQINADEYRVDASGKIGKSEGTSKLKYLAPHAEPFYLETSYKANLKGKFINGDDKSGAVAIKSNYGRGKSASINVEGAKTSTQEYTLHINANAPQAERLKKLDVSFNSKRPNHDTYNSNLIVDADGKVYKGDYLIVFSKANPVLEIKVNYPESKKKRAGNNMSSNQGKVELKLENIKDLSMDLNAEGIIQKDNIAFKVHANSEKLGLKNYYTEIVSKDTGSGKRLEFNAKNNNVNLLSGSTSFISKQEGSKTIIEGSGTVRLKEEQKSATFKYIRDTLTEGHEQGVETFMNVAVGERSYVAESRVTNLEYKYSYVYCEEKKQCAHAELNSKINTPSAGVFQHNVNVVLDLRKLGFAPEFGLQMLSEVSDRKLPQYTLDVYLNKENKKYHLRVYSTPKDNQLPAGITITLPHREIALESVVNYRGDKALPFPIKGEICLYMDKNKPHQKTSIRGLLDVTGSANEKTATAEIGFSHPRLGREAVLKFGGYLRQSSADNFKIEGVSSFSHPHFGHERSSKFLMEVSPRTFKLMMDTPLVKCIEVDAEGTVNDDLQEGKLKFSIMQGKPVQVYAVARGYKYYEFTTSYSEDTQRKLSIVGTIDPEKRVDLTADIVLPGEKKNIAHGAFYLQDNLVKSDYGGSKDNFDYFVAALMKDLDNLKERVSQLGSKASEEYRRTVEKAGQLANQLQNSYKTEMEHIKRELADDKTFQEIDKLLKSVIQYIGTLVVEVYEVADKLVTQINNAMQENAKKISELYETQLAPQINQLYENISAILKEYMEGLLDLVAHFTALVSNFIDKHKAELQELTNTFTEIFKGEPL